MALQALIAQPPRQNGPDQIVVFVQYYDDKDAANAAAPSVFIDEITIMFSSSAAVADVKQQVLDRGKALLLVLARVKEINATLSVPITIAVS